MKQVKAQVTLKNDELGTAKPQLVFVLLLFSETKFNFQTVSNKVEGLRCIYGVEHGQGLRNLQQQQGGGQQQQQQQHSL